MKYLLLFSFYIYTLQSMGQALRVSVDPQILQAKVQPAFDALNSVKDNNTRSMRMGRTSKQITDAEKIEQHRGEYCNYNSIAENIRVRLEKLCSIQNTHLRCSSAKDQTNLSISKSANIITSTTGVLETLYKARDQINEILSETITSNRICIETIDNNLLSDSCLRSFEIVLHQNEIDSIGKNCTNQQLDELKEYVSQILEKMADYLTLVREDYFNQRKAEVQIFNMIVRVQESINQLEEKQRKPTSD